MRRSSSMPKSDLSLVRTSQPMKNKRKSVAVIASATFLPAQHRRSIFSAFQYHQQPVKVLAIRNGLKDTVIQEAIRIEVDSEIGKLRQLLLVAGQKRAA